MNMNYRNIINNIYYKKCLYKGKERYIAFVDIGDKHYKIRTSFIVYNNEGKVFTQLNAGLHFFPGGSLETNIYKNTSLPHLFALNKNVTAEAQEECLFVVTNTRFTDILDIFIYKNKKNDTGIPDKVYSENGDEDDKFVDNINGNISFIYVTEYVKKYTGTVKKSDQSSFAKLGKWKTYKEIKDTISIKEKEAIEKHVPNSMYNSSENWKIFNHLMN